MSPHLARFFREISDAWWRYVAASAAPHLPPRRPFPPTAIILTHEDHMGLNYKVTLAPPVDADVVSHELLVGIDGVALDPIPVALGEVGRFRVPTQGSSVSVQQVNIDDAGLKGPASQPLVFVATDTIPPAEAGMPTVELESED